MTVQAKVGGIAGNSIAVTTDITNVPVQKIYEESLQC
jgi:hypothetical protein